MDPIAASNLRKARASPIGTGVQVARPPGAPQMFCVHTRTFLTLLQSICSPTSLLLSQGRHGRPPTPEGGGCELGSLTPGVPSASPLAGPRNEQQRASKEKTQRV